MRSVGFLLVTTVLVAVQLRHVLGQLANTEVVEDEGCICVKYFLCVNDTIRTTAGHKFIVPRASTQEVGRRGRRHVEPLHSSQPSTTTKPRSNECNNSLDVCCGRPNVRSSRLSAVTTPASTITNAAPTITNAAPTITDAAPTITDAAPTITNAAPTITNAAPSITDAAPTITDAAPTITDAAPKITDAAPTITDAAPTITDAAPCGRGNPDGLGFTTVAEDGETNFGEFPWVVAVLRRELHVDGSIRNAYECGGSLIHPQVVLTVAQCVVKLKLDDLIIRAGEWDTQTTQEPHLHQERSVRKVIIHENYDDNLMFNDIAILILEEPVTTDAHINVVCLPTQGETFDHTRCFAAGWGKNVYGKDEPYAVILKKIELPIVPHSTCENALRTVLLGPYYELDDSFVCAGGEDGIDTCQGDGGSPLVCPLVNNPNQFKQVGIVSWGLQGCGLKSVPGVYANVAARRTWIDQKMIANNFSTDSYTYTK